MFADDGRAFKMAEARRKEKMATAREKWISEMLADDGKALAKIFKAIDTDRSGTLSQKELFRYFDKTGKSALLEESKHLFQEMDADGDGEITIDELMTWLKMDHGVENDKKKSEEKRRASHDRVDARAHKPLTKTLDASVGGAWQMTGADCARQHQYVSCVM
jgi:hypothetical protein